ncbi:PepSY domain-containing protein [Solibacillus sp. MA9]|uniref:PepSY domain-containing protein n=1 Tax=Solibacillus palustris TaxID=2908203 RepID=A0ABS9UBX2_9BACL|nr:PepSY domain-containing protein [Solibacillus sp. MA9]MCH7321841.1 PepSY domain-containing protein [Solibacillus sp. MA9]
MNRKRALFIVTMIILTMFVVLAVKQLTTPKQLTIAEISKQVEQSYNAEIVSVVEKSDEFVTSFKKDGSVFEVSVNNETGQFSELTIIQQNNVPPTENTTEEQPSQPQIPTILTEQQVIEIALNEISGEIDSADFENTTDGGYYFVEMEQGNQEITIQIHAITGKILSIQYDD